MRVQFFLIALRGARFARYYMKELYVNTSRKKQIDKKHAKIKQIFILKASSKVQRFFIKFSYTYWQ